jgi:putative addiction module killer protein
VGDGLWEMRIDLGGGIRIYYERDGPNIYLLLDGGGKNGQSAQIAAAKRLWADLKKDRRK